MKIEAKAALLEHASETLDTKTRERRDRADVRAERKATRAAWEDALAGIAAILAPPAPNPCFPRETIEALAEHPMAHCASAWCSGRVGEQCGGCGGCHLTNAIENHARLAQAVASIPRSHVRGGDNAASFRALRAVLGSLEAWIEEGAAVGSTSGAALRTMERRRDGVGARSTAGRAETPEIERAGLMVDVRSACEAAVAEQSEAWGWTPAEGVRRLMRWQLGEPFRRSAGSWERPAANVEAWAYDLGISEAAAKKGLHRMRRAAVAELIARELMASPRWTDRNENLRVRVEARRVALGMVAA
ncbi:MAG: hypothetical protein RID81_06900 [Sandaracinaceae bacterium]